MQAVQQQASQHPAADRDAALPQEAQRHSGSSKLLQSASSLQAGLEAGKAAGSSAPAAPDVGDRAKPGGRSDAPATETAQPVPEAAQPVVPEANQARGADAKRSSAESHKVCGCQCHAMPSCL